jgi:apolipoprotein N-acyltransferase
VAAALAALWLGGWLAGRIEWGEPAGAPLRVALIQGNIPIGEKWLAQNRYRIAERYTRMSFEVAEADLVLWPESAIPAYRDELEQDFFGPLAQAAHEWRRDFLIGTVEREPGADGARQYLYNSAIGIGNDGGGVYRKRHLVPLGEFLPLASVSAWVFRTLEIPMSDFDAGPARQEPIALAGQRIGVSICYEAAFGEEIIDALPAATLLANLSEDAWFGDSLGPHQHLQMARMRSKETERALLRATNTGISAIIDARGALVARSAQFREEIVSGTVEPRSGATPYVRLGNYPVLGLALLALVFGRFGRGAKKLWSDR